MAFTALLSTEIAVGKPLSNELMTKIKDDLDYLYSQSGSAAFSLPNHSFEIDSDFDGIPDSWTRTLYAAGAGALSTSDPFHGERAFVFTRTSGVGNGGGELLSDYLPISTGIQYWIAFALKQSSAQPRSKVRVQYYTAAKTTLADSTIYDSTANPTTWADYSYQITPPASSRFVKILLIGGTTDQNNAGTISFDNIRFGEAMRQNMLKTSTVSGTLVSGSTGFAVTLAGGQYSYADQGFYSGSTVLGNPSYAYTKGHYINEANVMVMSTWGTTPQTKIWIMTTDVSTSIAFTVKQRYVTSSGELFWIFILREKDTKRIAFIYTGPDHPCFGNGGNPDKLQQPFSSYDTEKYEIIAIIPSDDQMAEMRGICIKEHKHLSRVIKNHYDIVDSVESAWPVKSVTTGFVQDVDIFTKAETVDTYKKIIPKPSGVKCYSLVKKEESK